MRTWGGPPGPQPGAPAGPWPAWPAHRKARKRLARGPAAAQGRRPTSWPAFDKWQKYVALRFSVRASAGANRRPAARRQRGGALLAVLWLSAALSAIVFTLAWSVRAELDRASLSLDGVRAHFLAQGAVERFLYQLFWSQGATSGATFRPGQRALRYQFSTGVVDLGITGENGKLSLVSASPAQLARLFTVLGVEEGQAAQIAAGIAGRRQGGGPSFSGRGASFVVLEDILTVPGMTPEIYYGWWERGSESGFVERGGVWRHLTLSPGGAINASYASPAVLMAAGLAPDAVAALVGVRETKILDYSDLGPLAGVALPGGGVLTVGRATAYTVEATAQLAGRPARRSVTALVRFGRNRMEPPIGVERWWW